MPRHLDASAFFTGAPEPAVSPPQAKQTMQDNVSLGPLRFYNDDPSRQASGWSDRCLFCCPSPGSGHCCRSCCCILATSVAPFLTLCSAASKVGRARRARKKGGPRFYETPQAGCTSGLLWSLAGSVSSSTAAGAIMALIPAVHVFALSHGLQV